MSPEAVHRSFDYPITFPPVDHKPALSRPSSPCEALQSGVVNGGNILDLLEAEKSTNRRSKRTYPLANNEEPVSLGNVWLYMNEDNVGYQAQGSLLKLDSNPASWELNENDDIGLQDHGQGRKIHDSQLITPPETTRKSKSKVLFAGTGSSVAQLPAFKNLTITKLLLPQGKVDEGAILHLQAVSNHQRWMTTQDAVRSGGNGIAKTTLNKLAAFRHKGISQNPSADTADTQLVQYPGQLEDVASEVAHRLSDHRLASSSDGPLRQSLENTEISDLSFSEPNREHSQAIQPSTDGTIDAHQRTSEADTRLVGANHVLTIPTLLSKLETHQEHQFDFYTRQTRYDSPTSSGNQGLYSLLGSSDILGVEPELARNESQMLPVAVGTFPEGIPSKSADNTFRQHASEFGATGINHSQFSTDFEADEFTEGLDDADLLAHISGGTTPGIGLTGSSKYGEENPSQPDLSSSSHGQRWPKSSSVLQIDKTSGERLESLVNTMAPSTSFPPTRSFSLTEYSIDAEEEEEMLKLLDPPAGVVQNFQAPVSFQQLIEDDSDYKDVYGSSLRFPSPLNSRELDISSTRATNNHTTNDSSDPSPPAVENWTILCGSGSARGGGNSTCAFLGIERGRSSMLMPPPQHKMPGYTVAAAATATWDTSSAIPDDAHEYEPLRPFVRLDLPLLVQDRCPIVGVSAQCFLRVCFRIGEMFRESARCYARSQDAVIELFARVTFSSHDAHTTEQHFQFADFWSNNTPFPTGILMNYKSTGLVESESRVFVGAEKEKMARCLGRLRRDQKSATGWVLNIANIRETEWEEIRWTKRIVGAGHVKSEARPSSNLWREGWTLLREPAKLGIQNTSLKSGFLPTLYANPCISQGNEKLRNTGTTVHPTGTMSRHRYETVPQRDTSFSSQCPQSTQSPIILSPIPNFNSGLPTSIASSISSAPSSPPPSFHTYSSPPTPRPAPSTMTQTTASTGSGMPGPYGDLWGVAPSTIGGEGQTSNDALATIAGLKQRVEWLEESIGRLLLEKETPSSSSSKCEECSHQSGKQDRNNCCVVFTDASPDLEKVIASSRSNCCVTFSASERYKKQQRRSGFILAMLVISVTIIMVMVLMNGKRAIKGNGDFRAEKNFEGGA
ncbi:uncharacterized protein BP5553_04435 [Venustampulla echinocandica]|uniref:Uncharacterized protein n=1 Tax=Venustampulla echinocandica TaxID=2656787 RepID=A0A370TNB1_9HELO|nr:uncharacterized protein BP5553_04435 [Venustampulla echinocandica]RDL37002.1 hypothetical protein BP5553_04435 [Venustampulla echinocandica]